MNILAMASHENNLDTIWDIDQSFLENYKNFILLSINHQFIVVFLKLNNCKVWILESFWD